MKDLSLKQLQDLGVNNFMSDKEIEKTLTKALESQQQSLNSPHQDNKQKETTLNDVLKVGGLFTWKLGDRIVRCSVLTPQDMQLLDNISNDVEQGVEYKELPIKYRYHINTALGNYLFIKAKSYDEAKKVVDNILGVGLYSPSAGNI